MRPSRSSSRTTWFSTLSLALLFAGCSGGGGDAAADAEARLTLQGVSITEGQTWQINRQIVFTFSHPVDFNSVSQSTIAIRALTGGVALGSFLADPLDSRVVVFQPTCPVEADLSDAGLQPGGVNYRVFVGDTSNASTTVRGVDGRPLTEGLTRLFVTPTSSAIGDLFIDVQPGPPTPRVRPVPSQSDVTTYLEVARDDANRTYFQRDFTGVGKLPAGYKTPLNLYSDSNSAISVIVEFNQPVNPLADNINSGRLTFQFQDSSDVWVDFATRVELVENCSLTGASVRLTPLGVLPQDSDLRILQAAEFEDLVGDRNFQPLTTFAVMESGQFEALGVPIEYADEVLEEFVLSGEQVGSREDTTTVFSTPEATWGGGVLAPSFDFDGTGGPNGTFDWYLQPGEEYFFDTTSTTISGGPGGQPDTTQNFINGRLDVRDLVVPEGATIRIQGKNPVTFLISGDLDLRGRILCNGNPAQSVFTPDAPQQPAAGASGNGGGGAGGIGSFLINQVTSRGGNGHGAFEQADTGGEGGESGYSPDTTGGGANRRAAGGGGGVFGPTVVDPTVPTCPDDSILGLDAESGFPGSPLASSGPSAIAGTEDHFPYGGNVGTSPFRDADPDNDFWGLKVRDVFGTPTLVTGELAEPHAGAGGGAGGDATRTVSYPPTTFVHTDQDKGAGGGGGGGSLTILCLGEVTIGAAGQIQVNGGHGAGGENTAGLNRIGGGSGGGSGGHLIIQTASAIDLSAVPAGVVAVTARGGQGGVGTDDTGGASAGERPADDAKHMGLPDNPWSFDTACTGTVVFGAGGDGGPGVIQFHVNDLMADINTGGANLFALVKPAPVGFDYVAGSWVDQLVPIFGSQSTGQSDWIPLGEVTVAPGSSTPDPILFQFAGTDPLTGLIESTGQVVDQLPPILSPAADVSAPGLPELVPGEPFRIQVDATELAGADVMYRRNPSLLKEFELVVGLTSLTVAAATYDLGAGVLELTVDPTGPPVPAFGLVTLHPRYFRLNTTGADDRLPNSATVWVGFQAAGINAEGEPDETMIFPSAGTWSTDINELTTAAAPIANTDIRFVRFRVEFDIAANMNPLAFDSPQPKMQYLRMPFRF